MKDIYNAIYQVLIGKEFVVTFGGKRFIVNNSGELTTINRISVVFGITAPLLNKPARQRNPD
ncbi:hypothetical protein [Pedobacter sp.]|uniref:hypothetical protein n=1 Tax=Pedobacter sp. TaxID=1411316 RepID=UPI0031D7EC0F